MAEIKTIDNSWSWHSLYHLGAHIAHLLLVMQTCYSSFLAGSSRSLFYGLQISACINLCPNTLFSGDSSNKVIQENRPRITKHNTLKWSQEERFNWFTSIFLAKDVKNRRFHSIGENSLGQNMIFQIMWMYATEDGVLPSLVLLTNGEHTQLTVFLQLSISSTFQNSQFWVGWIQGKHKWERAALHFHWL